MWKDTEKCQPPGPVSVLHVHGTGDSSFDGGKDTPSAEESVTFWAANNRCGPAQQGPWLNLNSLIIGSETETISWPNCARGTNVSFWIMHYARHIPFINASFITRVLDHLLAQRRL